MSDYDNRLIVFRRDCKQSLVNLGAWVRNGKQGKPPADPVPPNRAMGRPTNPEQTQFHRACEIEFLSYRRDYRRLLTLPGDCT